MRRRESKTMNLLLACAAALPVLALSGPASALEAPRPLDIPAESLDQALRDLARQSGVNVLFRPELTRSYRSQPLHGVMRALDAARALIGASGLTVTLDQTGAVIVGQATANTSDDPPSSSLDEVPTLEEVIVTASKRTEQEIDVPYSVSALSGEDLRSTRSNRFEDYLTKVAGANFVSSGEGTTQIFLRGITAGAAQASSTVGIYIDEAPYGSSTPFAMGATGAPDLDPSDFDRIEVLRGPQGTLYGANALGGVIKFVTTQPDTQSFSGRVDVGGSFVDGGGQGYNVSGAVNLPLVEDKLALRVSAYGREDPGYIDDTSRGLTDTCLRRRMIFTSPSPRSVRTSICTTCRPRMSRSPASPPSMAASTRPGPSTAPTNTATGCITTRSTGVSAGRSWYPPRATRLSTPVR
jgi:outer membrane receptor protein involved in Fe transport